MLFIYNIVIGFYSFLIRIAALFKPKAKLWIEGRKGLFKQLEQANLKQEQLIWIHAASLGEFEQGRPVINALKKSDPHFKILLTFFSPSGYEIRKNYTGVDYVFYLPIDSKSNARKFIQHIKPQLVIFIKYDLWYHYLNELQTQNIPTLLISASFRSDQFYFKYYGKWFLKVIRGFDQIFVQNETSKKLLFQHGITKVSLAGDTRVDRMIDLKNKADNIPFVERFIGNNKAMIFGSTWPEDQQVFTAFLNQNPKRWKYIIAPHNINEKHLKQIEQGFNLKSIRYSKLSPNDFDVELLIIDNIGMLSSIYQYGHIAYIGGAFKTGLHNTLEPIAFGLPVIFGPNYQKFDEAKWLVKNGGAFSIKTSEEFNKTIKLLEDKLFYQNSSTQALEFIRQNTGATKKIMQFITKLFEAQNQSN